MLNFKQKVLCLHTSKIDTQYFQCQWRTTPASRKRWRRIDPALALQPPQYWMSPFIEQLVTLEWTLHLYKLTYNKNRCIRSCRRTNQIRRSKFQMSFWWFPFFCLTRPIGNFENRIQVLIKACLSQVINFRAFRSRHYSIFKNKIAFLS